MSDRIKDACIVCFDAHKGDCSGFARAVADRLDIKLQGIADAIVDTLRSGNGWTPLPNGVAAAASAKAGRLVIGGLKGSEQAHKNGHGHVVVVVEGPLARGAYPSAYWGSLGGRPGRGLTTNFAWTEADRDRISYAEHVLPPPGPDSDESRP
jgi:hypothetical protein